MKRFIFSSLILLMIGCGPSKSKMKKTFDPWIGNNIENMINVWGPPTKTYVMPSGNSTVYTWMYSGGTVVSAYQYGNYGSASVNTSSCEFNWTVDKYNIIRKYNYKGSCGIAK